MALCATLSGLTLDCRDNVGGIEAVYIQGASGSIAASGTDGVIALTSISLDGSALTGLGDLETYECVKQTGALTETGTMSDENGTVFYTAVASTVFNKVTGAKLAELQSLAISSKLCVIVKDNNGKYWLVGNDRGAVVSASTVETGTAYGDRNGMTIEFTGIDNTPMLEVTVA
jgi:hypothetical protein